MPTESAAPSPPEPSAPVWRQHGQQALRAGRPAEARRAFRAALVHDPGDAVAWLELARLSSSRACLAYTVKAIELSRAPAIAHYEGARRLQAEARAELRHARRRGAVPAVMGPPSVRPAARALPTARAWAGPADRRALNGLLLLATAVVLAIALAPAAVGLATGIGLPAIPPVLANTLAQLGPVTATLVPPTATATNSATHVPTLTTTSTSSPSPTATASPEPSATTAATDEPVAAAPEPPGERWIDVSLGQQQVTAFEGNTPVRTFLASTGTWQYPTVQGQFHIYVKYPAADMYGPGYYLPAVPYIMYFYEGYGLHGTYWHSNFGTPMSHGCVNLETGDAAWLFDWASVGTLVSVHD
jgi:lipoprotein-anchoring transpeptidase ErfK/SrfK